MFLQEAASLSLSIKNTDGRFPDQGNVHTQNYWNRIWSTYSIFFGTLLWIFVAGNCAQLIRNLCAFISLFSLIFLYAFATSYHSNLRLFLVANEIKFT